MRYIFWVVKLALFLALLSFAFKNADPVDVRWYLGLEWRAPLVLVILVGFTAGVLVGILGSIGYVFRRRREVVKLRRELRARPAPSANLSLPATPETPDGV